MESLPAEVLHQICSYLQPDHRNVARFRLVCNRFAAVGIEHIIPTVYVAYHPRSLARLKEISEHPVIRRHVRTVCYLTDTIPIFDDFEAWRERAEELGDYDSNESNSLLLYSDLELENGWKEYQKCKAAQDQLWNTDEDVETFVSSVASLPSLRKVAMCDSLNLGSGTEEGHLFRRHPFDETLVADACVRTRGRSFAVKQFLTLLSAMKLCQPILCSLDVEELTWRLFMKLPSVMELKRSLSCLSHLRMHITMRDISFQHIEESEECQELMATGCIRRFVESAPNLETIELTFDMNDPNPTDWVYHLPEVLGGQTYSKLRRLALAGVEVSEDSLVTFLQRHAATLKDLGLCSCKATSPSTWFDIFTKIPKIVDLDEVLLRGYFYESQEYYLSMTTKIRNSDLRVGRVLEMVVCRDFTRKYGHPCVNEEEVRSQVLFDIAWSLPEHPEGLVQRKMKIRNTYLMCQLYEKQWDLLLAKQAEQEGYSDPLRYEAQLLWSAQENSEDEGSEYESLDYASSWGEELGNDEFGYEYDEDEV